MKNKVSFGIITFVILLSAYLISKKGSEVIDTSADKVDKQGEGTVRQGESRQQRQEMWKGSFKSQIDFWGKVIDQDGNPVANAKVSVFVRNNPDWGPMSKGGKKLTLSSDDSGLFEVRDERGEGLAVHVEADGYVAMLGKKKGKDLSRVSLSYAGDESLLVTKRPTKKDPHLFKLRKRIFGGELNYFTTKNPIKLSQTGQFSKITLGGVTIEVRCVSGVPDPFNYDPYNWSGEIRVLNAEVREIEGYDSYEAPIEGYEDSYKIDMPIELNDQWRRVSQTQLWFKTSEQKYGKINVRINTGRRHLFDAKLCINQDGSRNLDIDLNNLPRK